MNYWCPQTPRRKVPLRNFGFSFFFMRKEVIPPKYKHPGNTRAGRYERKQKKSSNSGCYIATCVYGSYDCPEVWTLRRYRDDTLATTWYGRTFIHLYYAISPRLVKMFGHTSWFKTVWRGKLDKMINELQKQGIENTPYEDKQW